MATKSKITAYNREQYTLTDDEKKRWAQSIKENQISREDYQKQLADLATQKKSITDRLSNNYMDRHERTVMNKDTSAYQSALSRLAITSGYNLTNELNDAASLGSAVHSYNQTRAPYASEKEYMDAYNKARQPISQQLRDGARAEARRQELINTDLPSTKKRLDELRGVRDAVTSANAKPTYNEYLNAFRRAGYGESDAKKMAAERSARTTYDGGINATRTRSAGEILRKAGYASEYDLTDDLSATTQLYNLAKREQEQKRTEDMVSAARKDPSFAAYARRGANMDSPVSRARGYYDQYGTASSTHVLPDFGETLEKSDYAYLTDDELDAYNYLYAKEHDGQIEKGTAQRYLDYLSDNLTNRKAIETAEKIKGKRAQELLFMAGAGLNNAVSGTINYFQAMKDQGKNEGGYMAYDSVQKAQSLVRNDMPGAWGVAADVVSTTANMLPSIGVGAALNAVLPGAGSVVGAGLMGIGAAGNTYQQEINSGYDKRTAFNLATASGLSETVTQYVLGGITALGGKLAGKVTGKTLSAMTDGISNAVLKYAVKTGGQQFLDNLSEGGEEALQSFMEPILRSLITGEKFKGYSDADLKEAAYSAALGFLSAAPMNAVSTATGAASNANAVRNLVANGDVQTLINLGRSYDGNSVAGQLAEEADANGGNISTIKGTMLLSDAAENLTEQTEADIEAALVERGIEAERAADLARSAARAAQTGRYDSTLRDAMTRDADVADVISNTVYDRASGVNERLSNIAAARGINAQYGIDLEQTRKRDTTEAASDRLNNRQDIASAANYVMDRKRDELRFGTRRYSEDVSTDAAVGTDAFTKSAAQRFNINLTDLSTRVNVETGVDPVRIEKFEKGKAVLAMRNGKTVSTGSAVYSDPVKAVLYEAAPKLDVDARTANAIIGAIHADTASNAFAQLIGMQEAIEKGKYNERLPAEGMSSILSEAQRSYAYGVGRRMTADSTAAAQKKVSALKETVVGKGRLRGTVKTIGIDANKLTGRQRAGMAAVRHVVNSVTKNDVVFYQSEVRDGKRVIPGGIENFIPSDAAAPNGFYDPNTGTVYIDVNSGDLGTGTIVWTAAHEFTHFMRQWSPEKYQKLADFLVREYETARDGKIVSVDALVQAQIEKAKRNGRTISRDAAFEEMVADSMQTMFTDTDALVKMDALKNADRSIWEKLKEYVTNLIARIREAYKGLTPDSFEAKLLRDMEDSMERLSDLFAEGLVEAGESFAAASETESSASEKVIRFDKRNPVEETKDLIAVHNLESERLFSQLTEWGGFPAPSIAITKAKLGHTKFGDTTVLFHKDTIDPAKRSNAVYSGDAYTPTMPQTSYKVNSKVSQTLSDMYYDLYKKYGEKARGLYPLGNYPEEEVNRKGLERITKDLKDNRDMQEVFLREKGLAIPEAETREEPVFAPAATQEEAQEIFSYFLFRDQNGKDLVALFNSLDPVSGSRVRFVREHMDEIRAAMKKSEVPGVDEMNGEAVKQFFLKAIRYDPNKTKTVTDTSKRDAFVEQNAKKEGYSAWIDGLLENLIEKKGIFNGKDMFYPSGKRRSWEQRHYEYNLKNIVRAMYSTQEAQGAGFFGNNLFGSSAQKYDSVDAIRSDKERLRTIDDEAYENLKSEYVQRLGNIADMFARDRNDWQNREAASDLLLEAVMKRRTRDGIAAYLKNEGAGWTRYSDAVVDSLISLVEDVRKMPTGYFEAKPARPVYADEIKGVVLPESSDVKLLDALDARGIPYLTYENENDADRINKVNLLADEKQVKFSQRNDTEYMTAVQNGDMETAQRMVDEAAEKAFSNSKVRGSNGKLLKVYHGTDADFWSFDFGNHGGQHGTAEGFGIYLTDRKEVSGSYGNRQISGYANILRPAYWNRKTLKRMELARLIKNSVKREARQMMEDDSYDNINDAMYDTWISNYVYTYEYSSLDGAIMALTENLLSQNDNDADIVYEVMNGMGIRDSEAASEFYDEILTPTTGIDGLWQKWNEGEKNKEANIILAFRSDQIKSADPVTYDDAGNVIPLSERFDEKNSDIRFSDRNPSVPDARTLLANALTDAAQGDLERERLAKYQEKIGEMNAEQDRLNELNAQIKELSFAKGRRDTARIRELRDEASRAKNRINIYDKQLLRMEASKPLERVLQVEKDKAVLRERAKAREKMREEKRAAASRLDAAVQQATENVRKRERERADERLDRTVARETARVREQEQRKAQRMQDRYEKDIAHRKEMRQKGIEQRKSTDLRGKIKRLREDWQRMLTKGNENTHIPVPLVNGMIDVCNMIDPTGEDPNTKSAEKYRTGREALDALRTQYDRLATAANIDADLKDEYRRDLSDELLRLAEAVGEKPLRDMDRTQLQQVYDTMVMIKHTLQNAKKQIGTDRAISNYAARKNIVETMQSMSKRKVGTSALSSVMRNWTLNPLRAVREMSGYAPDSELVRLFDDLDKGQRKGDMWRMEADKKLYDLRTGKNRKLYADAVEKPIDFGIKNMDGQDARLTKMQAMQILLTYDRETQNQHREHLASPIYIPDVKMLMRGKTADAIRQGKGQILPALTADTVAKLRQGLSTEWDKAFMGAAREIFSLSSDRVNETSMLLIGRPIATESAYIPYEVNKDFVYTESENIKYDASVANMGMTKPVLPDSSASIVMRGLNNVLDRHIDDVAKYYGIAVPVRNLNKALNGMLTAEDGGTPVKEAIRDAWGNGGLSLLQNAIADVQGPRAGSTIPLLSQIKQNWVTATLAFNASVWMKQAASYPTAGSILSNKALAKGLSYLGTDMSRSKREALWDEIDAHTAMHWTRRQGLSTQELGEYNLSHGWVNRLNNKLGHFSPMQWIQSMDVRTTAALWVACKAEVDSRGVDSGTAEYWNQVTELYEKVIGETQPMYDPLHRAEITKNKGQNFIFFQTQPIQNSGILREATMELRNAKKGKNKQEVKDASKRFGKAVTSQLASHAVFAAMTMLAASLLHKMNPYRDDEKEITLQSAGTEYLKQLAEAYFGAIVPVVGTYVAQTLDNVLSGTKYDVLSDPIVSKVNGTLTRLQNLKNPSVNDVIRTITDVLEYAGIPATNAYNIVNGIRLHVTDAVNGALGSFESGVDRTSGMERERLYRAMIAGDTEKVESLKKTFGSEDAYHAAIRKALADNDNRLIDAVVAMQDGDIAGYKRIVGDIVGEGAFSEADVKKAAKAQVSAFRTKIKNAIDAKRIGDDEEYDKAVNSLVDAGYDKDYVLEQVGDVETTDAPNWWETESDETDADAEAWYAQEDIDAAVAEGNEQELNTIYADLVSYNTANGKENPEKSATNTLKGAIKRKYLDGSITREQTEEMLETYADMDEDAIFWKLEEWDYGSGEEDESWNKYDKFTDAVRTGTNLKSVIGEYTDHGTAASTLAGKITSAFKDEYANASNEQRAALKGYLLNAYELLGYDRAKKSKDIDKWVK